MRSNFWSFLGFWIFQMIWVYSVGLSVVYLNASPDDGVPLGTAADIAGLILWIIGFLTEASADQIKAHHRFTVASKFKRENPGKTVPILDIGPWRYSRQPNYFGEILLWFGLFIFCLPSNPTLNQGQAYVTLISPLMTALLLMFLSGVPLAEQGYQKRYLSNDNKDEEARQGYLTYRRLTSPLIPLPRWLYGALPLWFKRVFLFELPLYETDYLKQALTAGSSSGNAIAPVAVEKTA